MSAARLVVLVSLVLLAACGGDDSTSDEDRAKAELRLVRQTLADVYPRLSSATGDTTADNAATLAYDPCGLSSISTGLATSASFALQRPTIQGERLGTAIATTLRSDGWTVPEIGADALQATKGRLTLSASYENLATLDLASDCIDVPDDVAERLGRRPPRDVELTRGR